MTTAVLRIGTRASALARIQAQWVARELQVHHPDLKVELVPVTTLGDRNRARPLYALDTPGAFVKELEEALRAGLIDLAVHSAKDVPTRLPPGLELAAFTQREDPADALVLPRPRASSGGGDPGAGPGRDDPASGDPGRGDSGRDHAGAGAMAGRSGTALTTGAAGVPGSVGSDAANGAGDGSRASGSSGAAGLPAALAALPRGARVGTSSLRRQAWLRARRPDLSVEPARGNLDTRLRRLDDGDWDALLLAAAGLRRLGLAHRITALVPPEELLPAPGQGALAIEIRAGDEAVRRRVAVLDRPEVTLAVRAERAFLAQLGGTCRVPLGAWAQVEGDRIVIRGMVAAPGGRPWLEDHASGPASDPEATGRRLAARLLERGAAEVLAASGVVVGLEGGMGLATGRARGERNGEGGRGGRDGAQR